jgi:phage gp36-like protein
MTYATQADLIARYGEQRLIDLTDREPFAGTIGASVVQAALAAADATIDGYLRGRYVLPLAPVPADIQAIAATLAFAALYVTDRPDTVAADQAEALRRLRDYAAGTATLAAAPLSGPQSDNGVQSFGDDRVFGRDSLKVWG